jgi:flagellar biosynthesis protein FlhF
MKLRRFFGPTSRAVLEQVRAELGPDAMIVANHASADGIEISALPAAALPQIHGRDDDESKPHAVPLATGNDDEGVTVRLSGRGRESTAAAGATSGPGARDAPGASHAPRATPAQIAAMRPGATVANGSTASAASPSIVPAASAATIVSREPVVPGGSAGTPTPRAGSTHADDSASRATDATDDGPATAGAGTAIATSVTTVLPDTAALETRMMTEMAAMRALFAEQMAELAWSESLRRSPLRSRLTRDLLLAGYSATLARTITERLPDDFNGNEAQSWLAAVLARNLATVDPADEIVTRGGVYALIGPTGVGKTTTTAKLAARCAVRYGAGKLALLTTDSYRVGAQDQLRIYAKILGVSVHTVSDRHDLRQALESVRGRHLVLIDTVGIGQRDSRVAEQAELLAHPEVARILLLNAAAQAETLEEVVTTYRRGVDGEAHWLAGAIVTKLDEAARTGGVLDVAIRHRLRLHYVTNGQRVPEDVALPHAPYLVDRSLRAAARPSPFALAPDHLALVATTGAPHAQ